MGFFQNILGIGGSPDSKTRLLPMPVSNDPSFDQLQGRAAQAIDAYASASSELLASGSDEHMPSTYDDLGGLTNTAMYNSLSPQNVNASNLTEYVAQLEQSLYQTDLTSPQSLADRARASSMFSGL